MKQRKINLYNLLHFAILGPRPCKTWRGDNSHDYNSECDKTAICSMQYDYKERKNMPKCTCRQPWDASKDGRYLLNPDKKSCRSMCGMLPTNVDLGIFMLKDTISHMIFIFSAGLHSSVFTCGKLGEDISLNFFNLPKILSSVSSHLRTETVIFSRGAFA